MAYSIFLSCADEETAIAADVRDFFNRLFGPTINIYFYGQYEHRTRWQESTRKALLNSDALISLFTPLFRNKPWAYIEFTPFWLKDAHAYFLCLEPNLGKKHSLPIVDQYNFFCVQNTEDVRRFLEGIGKIAFADDHWTIQEKDILSFKQVISDGIAKSDLHKGSNDAYAELVARWQYENGDFQAFMETMESLSDDVIKKNVIQYLFANKGFDLGIEALDFVYEIRYVRELATALFKAGNYPPGTMDAILDKLESNNGELRNFAIFLININKMDTSLFDDVLTRMSNNAEIRNVVKHAISKNGFSAQVRKAIKCIKNDAEIKNLLVAVIRKHQYNSYQFVEVMNSIKDDKHRAIVLEELRESDPAFTEEHFQKL